MKKEKYCFNKGVGLAVLIGIFLVGAVLVAQSVMQTRTSINSRASSPQRANSCDWPGKRDWYGQWITCGPCESRRDLECADPQMYTLDSTDSGSCVKGGEINTAYCNLSTDVQIFFTKDFGNVNDQGQIESHTYCTDKLRPGKYEYAFCAASDSSTLRKDRSNTVVRKTDKPCPVWAGSIYNKQTGSYTGGYIKTGTCYKVAPLVSPTPSR